MNLEFTVTETITHMRGKINEIHYQFEEFTLEKVSVGITNKTEKRSRLHDTNIRRDQYNELAKKIPNALTFDNFIIVLRPFIMGYYGNNELKQAFQILDKDQSKFIHIDELASFLPIINEFATTDVLKNYIRKVDINSDGNLSYDEFRSLILKGIGRDIICNHI